MSVIIYMRFTARDGSLGPFYMVGASRETMEYDAPGIACVAPDEISGEVVNSEVVVSEAKRRSTHFNERSRVQVLDEAVAATRVGTKSYYLFG